ncbi:UTP--glucose-1-phosphate uridylyltransferase, partial [Gammaproteobacteria bacterium]|nr:UTP--glucose-1-phosphate uridylyltransferase [Gammaproteobacteria bacterium]
MHNKIKKLTKAIIPVAGLGTRMLPATKAIPKELLPIYDRPIIEHVVQEAITAGITEIIFITRSGKEAIENHFDMNYELEHRLEKKGNQKILKTIKNVVPKEIKISSIRQNNALGLGHAVLCAKHVINDEPFAVLLPDKMLVDDILHGQNYSFSEMRKAWDSSGIGQIMVEKVKYKDTQSYGIVNIKGNNPKPFSSIGIKEMVEKPLPEESPSDLAILGRYILPFDVMNLLEDTPEGVGGEIQLTDALDKFLKKESLNAFISSAKVFDCGIKKGFIGANLELGMRDPETADYLKHLFKTF